MKKKHFFLIFISVPIILSVLLFILANVNKNNNDNNTSGFLNTTTLNSLPNSHTLNIPIINQLPDLPTGCEITALAQVLTHLGYNTSNTELADNYLDCNYDIKPGCFMDYFVGSPYESNSCGCFAPALTLAANRYLKSHNSPYKAHNISYSDPDELLYEISIGNPVIVWTCLDPSIKDIEYTTVPIEENDIFDWPNLEHCAAISGYDLSNQTITFSDPTYGLVTQSMADFKYFYKKFYYQAIVIK